MKPIFVLATIFLFTCTAPVLAAGLVAETEQIDFGSLKEGPPAQKSVTLTNTGSEPITITNVSTSCACTTTELSTQELAPGESAELTITYQTYKYAGKFDKTVTIETDQEEKAETVIHLVGYVDPMPMGVLEMNPRKVDVGTLSVNQPNTIAIKVRNSGDAPLTVSRVVSIKYKKTYYEKGDAGVTIPPGEERAVSFPVVPSKVGRFLDIILVHSEDARNDAGQGYKAVLLGQVEE